MGLVVTLQLGEIVNLGPDISFQLTRIRGQQVRIQITAPNLAITRDQSDVKRMKDEKEIRRVEGIKRHKEHMKQSQLKSLEKKNATNSEAWQCDAKPNG